MASSRILFRKHKYRFTHYTEAYRYASFEPLEKQKFPPLRVVIESPEMQEDELERKIEAANFGTQNPKIEVVIAVSTSEKYEEIKHLCTQNIVFVVETKAVIGSEKAASKLKISRN